ncbi:hypothetical protein Tco_0167273 [Tanacetum coccineum]
MEECHLLLTDQVDLVNPEGHRVVHCVSKPLLFRGPPGQSAQSFIWCRQSSSLHAQPWIRNIVIKKRIEDLQLMIESYQTKLNLTQPNWDAYEFMFKEDYTIVSKPRAVIYRDRTNQKKMMRETEVHKFSDGMLNRIMDKLDHMVKDFKFNSGTETRIWSEDD